MGGVGGPIDLASACQMMLKLQFFPRVLSKIVNASQYLKIPALSMRIRRRGKCDKICCVRCYFCVLIVV